MRNGVSSDCITSTSSSSFSSRTIVSSGVSPSSTFPPGNSNLYERYGYFETPLLKHRTLPSSTKIAAETSNTSDLEIKCCYISSGRGSVASHNRSVVILLHCQDQHDRKHGYHQDAVLCHDLDGGMVLCDQPHHQVGDRSTAV